MEMYLAYTYKRGKEIRSGAYRTREEAACELFSGNAKLASVATAVAVKHGDTWTTYGRNIQPVTRRAALAMCGDKTAIDPREAARQKFRNVPLLWVVHVNSFTRKIESAYMLVHGVKSGGHITAAQFGRELAENPQTPVEFLSA